MDMLPFLNDNFDPKEWINSILKPSAVEDKKVTADHLVSTLQSYMQKVNDSLEENSERVLTILPDIIVNIESLKQEVLQINEEVASIKKELKQVEVASIKKELKQVEDNTNKPIITLERIDNIKSSLEKAKEALHEADNWSVLASDIEDVFIDGNIDTIAEKLVSMQQSLNVLSNSDDYEDRRIQLEGLKNRLEAIVVPKITHTFMISDTEEARKIVSVFTAIERIPELLRYYIKCQKGYLCQQWKTLVDSDQDQLELVRAFYNLLLNNWQTQIKWCNEVFPTIKMRDRFAELYADVLLSLNPGINVCIDLALKQNSQPLLLLLQFHCSTIDFHNNLKNIFISANGTCNDLEWKNLIKSMYTPYSQYATKYCLLERHLLDDLLWTTAQGMDAETNDLTDSVQNATQTVSAVMNIATDAKGRCLTFTYGCSFPGLIEALKGFFLKYIERYKKIANDLKMKISSKEDWSLFHICLSFQQVIGELLNCVKNYDISLVQDIASNRRQLQADPYVKILLSSEMEKEYKELLTAILNGSKVSVLDTVISTLEKLCHDIHNITHEVILKPVTVYLSKAKHVVIKLNREQIQDLPDYSYSPLEYITQIGEYLLTLPQHLEPFLMHENPSLITALNIVDPARYKNRSSQEQQDDASYVNAFLMEIVQGVCQAFVEQILSFAELNIIASKQLAVDIEYLGNLLEELGVKLTETLRNISLLLRILPEDYHSKCSGCNPKLVAAVRQIRNIPPNE